MRSFINLPIAVGRKRRKKKAFPVQPPRARPAPTPATTTLADLKPCLRALLSANGLSDPVSREAEAKIKKIGDICGLYLTASAVQSYVASLSPTRDAEKKNMRPRGFELAGELYYLHVRGEIESIEENTMSLGPIVFRSYCSELFDCFLMGEHVRKGVGYPIMLTETLLGKAATLPDKKDLYLALADQAMESMEELSRRKFEKDILDALRAAREGKHDNGSKPEVKSPHEIIDRELFEYLQRLHKGYAVVRAGFQETKFSRTASEGASGTRNYIAYLHALLKSTIQGHSLGLTAMMNEMLGRTLHAARQEEYGDYILTAARDIERLADEERDLYLIVMSAQHYRKAQELYSFAGERESASSSRSKLTKLKTAYDPQMLVISKL